MSVIPDPVAGAGRPEPGLHVRRCARHPGREAAARCPGCREFFCRECVLEHEGRLLCAACLAREGREAPMRRRRWAGIRRGMAFVAGVIVLWLIFYELGALLVKIPPSLHEDAFWQRPSDRANP